MSAAFLCYLHHRPAARTWRPLELPGKPSPLGQVCRIQIQAAKLCKKKAPSLCADTLWPALAGAEKTFGPFLAGERNWVVPPTQQRDFPPTVRKAVRGSPPCAAPTHVEDTSHTQVGGYSHSGATQIIGRPEPARTATQPLRASSADVVSSAPVPPAYGVSSITPTPAPLPHPWA